MYWSKDYEMVVGLGGTESVRNDVTGKLTEGRAGKGLEVGQLKVVSSSTGRRRDLGAYRV